MSSSTTHERVDGVAFPVRVTESARRKKTVSAKVAGGVLDVRIPAGMAIDVRDQHIRDLASRLERRRASKEIDLTERAAVLAKRYDLPLPTSIEWSGRQNTRWGSCTPANGSVRISDRLSGMPHWVVDYVIVHELAHMVHFNHDADFHALVARFPRAERAEGFLEAVSLGYAHPTPSDSSLPH